MSQMTGAKAMVRMLQLHGVKHIFGLCGDTSLPFYDALYRLDHGMQHILTRDERSAAYMADGYARVSERVGVKAGRVETPEQLKPALAAAARHGGPAPVDIVTQPLHEARAPVSEWVA